MHMSRKISDVGLRFFMKRRPQRARHGKGGKEGRKAILNWGGERMRGMIGSGSLTLEFLWKVSFSTGCWLRKSWDQTS